MLFTSWFVRFDPVRAKMAGLPTGLPAHIEALFPDALVDSELGEVPEGWGVGTLSELCSLITSGGTPSRGVPDYWNRGVIPWIKSGELHDGVLLDSGEHITSLAVQNSNAKLFPRHTIVMAIYAAPTVGRLGLLASPASTNQACVGLVPKPEYGAQYLFQVCFALRRYFNERANGAAQQNISQRIVTGAPVLLPPLAIVAEAKTLLEILTDQLEALAGSMRTLSSLRDTLLPKLVSGEVRITDPEAFLRRAGLDTAA